MPTLPNMGLITPTAGGDSGSWDDKINAAFVLVDAHDHTPGKGVLVPIAGLNINADLPMGGFFIANVGKVSFSAIAAPSTGSKAIFVNSADNELYWRTNGGVNVKLTSGTTINASLIGGIGGDYASVGAEVAYVDADATYTFKDKQTPKKWARLQSGPHRIAEFNTNEAVYVELAAPAALAASYTVTWPTAVPGVQSLMQMSTAGVMSLGGSGIDHDVSLAANRSFQLAVGTGKYKHGAKSLRQGFLATGTVNGAGSGCTNNGSNPGVGFPISSTNYIMVPIPLHQDAVVASITLYFSAAVGAGVVARLYEGANAAAFSYLSIEQAGSGSAQIVLNCASLALTGVHSLWVRIVTDGASNPVLGDCEMSFSV